MRETRERPAVTELRLSHGIAYALIGDVWHYLWRGEGDDARTVRGRFESGEGEVWPGEEGDPIDD